MTMIVKIAKRILKELRKRQMIIKFETREKNILQNLGLYKSKVSGEEEYSEYWYPIVKAKTPWAFRLYGAFTNYDKRVISQNAANIINDILNPKSYRGFITDKNNFDIYIGSQFFPRTIVRKINGGGYSIDYKLITQEDFVSILNERPIGSKIILKPSVNSSSGIGVEMYEKDELDNKFHLKDNWSILLDPVKFSSIGNDIIIQEAMSQSDYISQFNPSSINTLRIATYRSVKNDQVHILSSVIRIGSRGSIVDNLHAGGKMVRISDNGTLANYCIDQYGQRYDTHNDIDFTKNSYSIPEWEKIVDFAKEVSSKILHARLVQLDVMLDKDNNPHLIEFNVQGFSMWIAQFTGTPAFGYFTDEIREYAIANLKDL